MVIVGLNVFNNSAGALPVLGIVLVGIVSAVCIVGILILWQRRAIAKHLQDPSPKSLLRFYDLNLRTIFQQQVLVFGRARGKSVALSYYGDFDRATLELQQLDVENAAPILLAMKLNALVIKNCLQGVELEEALFMAKKCMEFSEIPKGSPGRKTGAHQYQLYVEITALLNGVDVESNVAKLAHRFPKALVLQKLLVAWALGNYYSSNGAAAKADEMRAYIQVHAPHCRPLQGF